MITTSLSSMKCKVPAGLRSKLKQTFPPDGSSSFWEWGTLYLGSTHSESILLRLTDGNLSIHQWKNGRQRKVLRYSLTDANLQLSLSLTAKRDISSCSTRTKSMTLPAPMESTPSSSGRNASASCLQKDCRTPSS